MSIKTDGLIEGGPFKVTAGVSAGFVKNDASGNLLFGQAASAWELIDFQEQLIGPFTEIEFTGLDGDVDEVYQLIFQAIGQSSSSSSSGQLKINGAFPILSAVTRTVGELTTSANQFQGGGNRWRLWSENGAFQTSGITCRAIIYTKSGKIRTGDSWASGQRRFGLTERAFEHHNTQRWNDTTTNITSLGIAATFAVVDKAWLYKIKTT